jgi:hypothetical protein
MGKQLLIGIAGKKHSGKTTAAVRLKYNHGLVICNFADPLKSALMAALNVGPQFFMNEDLKEKNIPGYNFTPRKAMQFIGTEGFRKLQNDVWLVSAGLAESKRLAEQRTPYCGICYADVRMPNEAEWIRQRGGVIVNLIRPCVQGDTDTHPSEAGLPYDLIDYTIYNDGALHKLSDEMDTLVRKLRTGTL